MCPIGDSFIGFQTAIVGIDTRRDMVLNPPLCAVLFAVGHEPHRRFHAMREQFGNTRLGCKLDSSRQRRSFRHLRKILFNGNVRTKMQVVLQFVSVYIPHTVEITGCEPVGIEYLLRLRATDAVQQQALKLIVRQAVLRSRTDVVVVLPELLRHFGTAYPLQQSSAIFDSRPLQHTADRHVEHDGVVVLENSRIENTRLTQTHPCLDTRIGDDALGLCFGQTVMVVCRHTYRVTGSTPMERFATVAHLSYGTDIDHFRLMLLLSQNSLGDVLRCRDIRAQRCFGTIVRLRRNHTAHMQHDVCTCHSLEHVFVLRQVTPNNVQCRVIGAQRSKEFFVFRTRPRQNAQLVLIGITQDFSHSCVAHGACSTG